MSKPEHVLLTSLGIQAKVTEYTWRCKSATTRLAPLALMKLMKCTGYEPRPDHVIAVVTSGVKQSKPELSNRSVWDIFREGIQDIMCLDPVAVDVPDGHNADEIRDILGKVANSVPEKVDLTLDVTHGFRHFPFVFYALVLYLKSLRGVNVRGAYYGLVEGVSSEQKPILDLQPLLDLPEWFYAVRMFREHGTPLPIRDLIEPLESVLREEAHKSDDSSQKDILFRSSSSSGKAAKELGRYAFAYGSALPLELGRAAKSLANPLNALSEPQCQHLLPPLSDLLIKDIVNVSDRYSIKTTNFTGEWKRTIVLDECELARQARMIDSYLDRGQIPLAVGLMREWVVSWMMFKDGTEEDRIYWIEENRRRPFEHGLGELLVRIRDHDDKVSKEQKEFGKFWTRLTIELRNALHHHGMRPREIANPQGGGTLDAVRDFWGRLNRYEIEPPK